MKSTELLFRSGQYRIVRRLDTKACVITCTIDGQRYRFKAGDDLRGAKRRLVDFKAEIESGWRPGRQSAESWEVVAKRVRGRHKWAAKQRGIPFDLTAQDVYREMKEAGFQCPLSGIPFSKAQQFSDPLGLRDPWAPSIDRIDNRQGYSPDNIRVVCVAANMAMNAWGFDTLLRLARGVVRNAAVAVISENLLLPQAALTASAGD